MTNLYSTLAQRFETRLDSTFLRVPAGRRLTYREVDHRSACIATVLRDLGVAVGDRVAYASSQAGAYAQERVMPADRLVRIPDGVSDRLATMLAACLAAGRSHASWKVRLAVAGACDLLQVRSGAV